MDLKLGSHTYSEITSQGQAWEATITAAKERESELRAWLEGTGVSTIVIGWGSTYYLSLSAAVTWQTLTGRPARAIPSSELWLFPESSVLPTPSFVMAVSRSGATTETLRAIDMYRERRGTDVLAVTCYADQPMQDKASLTLVAKHAEEESVAQTRSFSSMLLLTQMVTGFAAGREDFVQQLVDVPAKADRIVAGYEGLARQLAQDSEIKRFVFLGSGNRYGLACEAMLKMKEMSLSYSEAFHFLEFRHGPKSVVGKDMLVVGLLSETAKEQEVAVLAEMRELGARVLAITETPDGITADHAVILQSGASELTQGLLMLPFLQFLAFYRSTGKGLNPDRPENLEAVVML